MSICFFFKRTNNLRNPHVISCSFLVVGVGLYFFSSVCRSIPEGFAEAHVPFGTLATWSSAFGLGTREKKYEVQCVGFFFVRTNWPECPQFVLTSNACETFADFIILIDSSASISSQEYENFKTVLSNGIYDIIPTTSRLTIIQYSNFPKIELQFIENFENWPKAIQNMNQLSGIDVTSDAFQFVIDDILPLTIHDQTHIILMSDAEVRKRIFFFVFFYFIIVICFKGGSPFFPPTTCKFSKICIFFYFV